jgi:hypothetical protein
LNLTAKNIINAGIEKIIAHNQKFNKHNTIVPKMAIIKINHGLSLYPFTKLFNILVAHHRVLLAERAETPFYGFYVTVSGCEFDPGISHTAPYRVVNRGDTRTRIDEQRSATGC